MDPVAVVAAGLGALIGLAGGALGLFVTRREFDMLRAQLEERHRTVLRLVARSNGRRRAMEGAHDEGDG